jgi:hypothetical protein
VLDSQRLGLAAEHEHVAGGVERHVEPHQHRSAPAPRLAHSTAPAGQDTEHPQPCTGPPGGVSSRP